MASIRIRGMVNKGLQVGGLLSRNQGFRGFCNNIPSQLDKTLTINQTDAALSLTKHLFLKEEHHNKNVVFSPLSIYVALSMVAAGSEGRTLHELLTFLRAQSTDHLNSFASRLTSYVLRDAAPDCGPRPCSSSDSEGENEFFRYVSDNEWESESPSVCFANGAWVEQSIPLQPSFKQLLTTDYNATLASVDFRNKAHEVVDEVNLWAEEKTKGRIKSVLSPGSANSLTRFILANALYFKGAWYHFNASRTRDDDFHLLNGTSVKVPFMAGKGKKLISAFDGFKVVGLPYDQGKDDERQFSMYIFLPDANDGLSALVEQVTFEPRFLERHLPYQEVEVGDFRIPKFKISFGLNISDVVKEMGLALPFSSHNAQLTKMTDSLTYQENLYVSNIIHKSFIEVNEVGTEAAAFTCMAWLGAGPPTYSKKIDFVADHPFLFVIREDLSGTVLFIGQVLHPRYDK